ncbi:prepilin-type N-terminal cleavage/methylation domain-containing protein [bacterium]|nr:prepilin-type N-terminal cleavage/methylation domain-containing protein [bacterium]
MKAKRIIIQRKGLTFIEVVVALAILAVIIAVILPMFARPHIHSARISCLNHLQQVGLSFRIWANDHGDLYPMQVAKDKDDAEQAMADTSLVRIFQVMSNELSVPNTAICPADARVAATNWNSFSIANISYFVGLDAADTRPKMILSGDRDIAENGRLLSGTANLTTNRPVAWHRLLHKEGGNLLFADGSVQQVNTIQLRAVLSQTGDATNRVLFPQ